MSDRQPFDDIRDLITSMPSRDQGAYDSVVQAFKDFPGPRNPLGRLQAPVAWLAGWQGTHRPNVTRPLVAVFAGTHGVANAVMSEDIVASAKDRIKDLTDGPAAVRGVASSIGAAFKVYEMGLEYPSADMRTEASLSERDCAAAIAFGMEVVAEGADIIVLGNAGYGAATAAAGIARGLYGGKSEYWAGGEGDMAKRRIEAVESAAAFHRDILSDPLHVLRGFGGRDIAGQVGAILAARHQSIPIILDGFVVCAAAAVLHKINPRSIDHCLAGHITSEPAHGALLDRLGLKPMQDYGISLGDGTGGALALSGLRAAVQGFLTLVDNN